MTNPLRLVVISLALFANYASAQARQNNAVPVLERSIAAMGGNAWQSVGAATAEVTVAMSDGLAPTTGKWSDDWSSGQVYSRREWTGAQGKLVRLSDDRQAVTYANSASPKVSSPDYDLVNIALTFPAVALRLGLSRATCSFYDHISSQTKQEVIFQLCASQFYPNKQVLLKWIFDPSSGLPISLEFPVLGRDGSVVSQIARFKQFESSDGLRFPSAVDITQVMTRHTRTLTFTETQFHSALDKSEFSIH
ncbi:MAG TPA: hypothetical protein VK638_27440 [Edaphobacter sp.]|nr:hypothetical protein [Edaphobacter sp.]